MDRGREPDGDPDRGLTTVWVWGDQLDLRSAHLRGRDPGSTRVLMVVSDRKLGERRWHRQKVHLVVTAMRRFADQLTQEGFAVDLRRAPSMRAGLAAHVDAIDPSEVVAMEPASRTGTSTLEGLGVRLVDNDHFLCHWSEFATFRAGRGRTTMEDFYRWRRRSTGWLMEGRGAGSEAAGTSMPTTVNLRTQRSPRPQPPTPPVIDAPRRLRRLPRRLAARGPPAVRGRPRRHVGDESRGCARATRALHHPGAPALRRSSGRHGHRLRGI